MGDNAGSTDTERGEPRSTERNEPGGAGLSERSVLEGVPTELYIDGHWRPATGAGTLPVEDPSTGDTLLEVADAQPADALAALAAAGARGAKRPR